MVNRVFITLAAFGFLAWAMLMLVLVFGFPNDSTPKIVSQWSYALSSGSASSSKAGK